MKVLTTNLPGVLILEPKVFGDSRGFFLESFNQKSWQELTGLDVSFVQDNHSRSGKNVLRGLHYQLPPHAQGKLVRCVVGRIYDVAVDIRRDSATFGKWVGVYLSEENYRQLWIPPGFAHGFCVVSDRADVLYKTTDFYAPECERSIRWDDADLGIDWPLDGEVILSSKDGDAPLLNEAELF
ncbi:MAG: dTDP-4-dehydrorhamnose 3,5-epimerase [Deltaproteobacteria bacterium]|nr:MAG: dTDP-4-dehydrorhamnose 3,5-epimerase [Deltaproteobacteria bacterium]